MNCFDCSLSGDITPALGTCTNCGGGVCAAHVELDAHESPHTPSPGLYTPHVTRMFICTNCAAILHPTSSARSADQPDPAGSQGSPLVTS